MEEYVKDPYEEKVFYKALRKKYQDLDSTFLKFSRPFLDTLVSEGATERIKTKDYIEWFHRVSMHLKKQGAIDNLEQCRLFLNGLPKRIVSKIVKTYVVDQNDPSTFDYNKFYKTATETQAADEVVSRFQDDQNPVVQSARASTINEIVRNMVDSKKRVKTTRPAVAARGPTTYTIPAAAAPEYDPLSQAKTPPTIKVEDITKMFKDLSINHAAEIQKISKEMRAQFQASVAQIQQNATQNQGYQSNYGQGGYRGGQGRSGYGGSRGQQYPPPSQPDNGVTSVVNTSALYNFEQYPPVSVAAGQFQRSPPERYCYACHGLDSNGAPERDWPHIHSDKCYQLNDLIANRVCHKNREGRLCIGTPRSDAQPILLRSDEPWVKQIKMSTVGTRWDPNVSRRKTNVQQEQTFAQDVEQGRASQRATGSNAAPLGVNILKRAESSKDGTVSVNS